MVDDDSAKDGRNQPAMPVREDPTLPPMTVEEAVAAIRSLRPIRPLSRDEIRSFIDDGRRFSCRP